MWRTCTHTGFVLCLSLVIDRFHNYIRELNALKDSMEAAKKQIESVQDGTGMSLEEEIPLVEELAELRPRVKELESECELKDGYARDLEADKESLMKQAEGYLLQYDRVERDNQNLRSQLDAY